MSKVRVKTGNGEEVIGEFMGIFQMSDVIPPSSMVGGHTGGVVSMPVAVVKLETGELKQSKIGDVIFDVTPREEPRVHEDSMDAHSYVLRQQERLRQGYSKPTTDDELKQLKLDLNSHSGVVRKGRQLTPEEIAEKRGDIKSIVYHETGKRGEPKTFYEMIEDLQEELMTGLVDMKKDILEVVNIQPPTPPPIHRSLEDLTNEAIKAATRVTTNHGPINPDSMTTEAVKMVYNGS